MARPKRRGRGWQQRGRGAKGPARLTDSPRTPSRRITSSFPRPVGCRWTISRRSGRMCVKPPRGKGRLFTPFPAVSQLLPVLQIHFRSHADIYTHVISLLYGFLRHSGLSRALFQVLLVQHPGLEMECQQVCFTSASDYIPPVPLGSIFTRFRTNRVQNVG